jgi:hypothetical protein
MPSREKSGKACHQQLVERLLRSGFRTRIAKYGHYSRISEQSERNLSAFQTAWRRAQSGATFLWGNSLLTGKITGNLRDFSSKTALSLSKLYILWEKHIRARESEQGIIRAVTGRYQGIDFSDQGICCSQIFSERAWRELDFGPPPARGHRAKNKTACKLSMRIRAPQHQARPLLFCTKRLRSLESPVCQSLRSASWIHDRCADAPTECRLVQESNLDESKPSSNLCSTRFHDFSANSGILFAAGFSLLNLMFVHSLDLDSRALGPNLI